LEKNADIWKQRLLSATTEASRKKHKKKYAHPKVRVALETMCNGKCAYCESKIKHVSTPQIEHYRPSSKWLDKTFEWENLLLACGECNGSQYKGDKFPEANEGGPIVNPCEEDPDAHLSFIYDPIAKIATVVGKTRRGEITKEALGLNRHELRKHRSLAVRRLASIAHLAATDDEAHILLEEAKQSHAEYSAFARLF
jgi:uncharacterized protein (TIGR02646 family)